jgi:tetratricopeptide (TPR) repeat protein
MRFSLIAAALLLTFKGVAATENARALLGMGLENLQFERFEAAANYFRRALEIDPKLVTAQYDLGVCMFAEGRFDDARIAFQKTLQLAGNHRFAAYYLARVDLLQNRVEESIKEFEELGKGKTVADELYYVGAAYFRNKQPELAMQTLNRAVEVLPKDNRVHFLLARVYRELGRNSDAEKEFKVSAQIRAESQTKAREITGCETALKALAREPAIEQCKRLLDGTDSMMLVSLGALLAQKGYMDAALVSLNRATRLDPENYEAAFNLGLTYFKVKQYADAKSALVAAVALRRESFDAVALLASSEFALGEDYAALEHLRLAHELQPANARVRGLLLNELRIIGRHAIATENFPEAVHVLEEASALSPGSPEIETIAFQVANKTFRKADYESTVRLLNLTGSSLANSAAWHALRGYTAYKQGDAGTAVVEIQKALDLDPRNEDYLLELSEVLVANNNAAAAVLLLEPATKMFPDSARLRFSLGTCYLAADRLALAEAALKRSFELDPSLDLALVVLAQGYRDAGLWNELSVTADKLLASNPRNHLGYFYKAVVLACSSDLPDAQTEALLRKSSELDASDPDPRYELAKLLVRKGQPDEAQKQLETIIAAHPDFAKAYFQLYRLYARKGDVIKSGEAERTYEKLRNQRDPIVRKLLVEVRER